MPSRAKALALAALLGALPSVSPGADAVKLAPLAPLASSASPASPAPSAHVDISPTTLETALAELRNDPNLGGESKIRTLRWVNKFQPRPPPTSPNWIIGFFDYVGQFAGLMLWIFGAGAAAVAAIWVLRLLKSRAPRVAPVPPDAAERTVLDLDIRPDSLPDDVSAAALALLRAGRLRDALSLLYRASLSSAVHRFGVTLGAQLTEREVLKAVKLSLDEARARYFADLVATWQRVVYAGEAVSPDTVLPLCAAFSTHFERQPP